MPGRRGARTGRGWDAAPARPRRRTRPPAGDGDGEASTDGELWLPDEEGYRRSPAVTGPALSGDDHDGDRDRDNAHAARRSPGRPRPGAQPAEIDRDPAGPMYEGHGPGSAADTHRDPAERAREICLGLLAVRPRTRAELATALRRRGVAEEVAAEVLDRYDDVGIIDDAAFARAWVTSRHHGQGLARRALAAELRRKGVDSELTGAALTELDPDTEMSTARALVDRRLRGMAGVAPEVVLRRLVGVLARKGYPAGLAFRVVKETLAAREDELAGYAELVDPEAADALTEPDA